MTAQTIQAQEKQYYSPEEYLALEEVAEYKSEYFDGQIIPATGGTTNHNQITGNVYAALNFELRRQPYRVFFSDVRLWIPRKRFYKYPDVMVIAGQPEYYNSRKDTITNPQIIIEVLSESTQGYDRDQKFVADRKIPTFQEYILIDQTRRSIDQYFKTANKQWSIQEHDEEDLELVFKSLEFRISLLDIYNNVEFEPAEEVQSE